MTAMISAAASVPAWAAQTHSFTIDSQSAQTGVAEFARQANVDILISSEAAADRRTAAVKGDFETRTALRLLLAGTGLEARRTGDNAYTVVVRRDVDAEPASATAVDTVVVTARAGIEMRNRADTSYSVSIIPQERLRLTGVSSVADSLRNVPGFWVENSGGEASANVRARGIPVDGYASVQLAEDGMPIQHDPGLGYLNADQSFRLDETISQIQVVRGGPSTVFSSNAPGGLVNYITRKAGPVAEGLAKVSVGDDGLFRTDFWYGGPIGDWRVAMGGFYRTERGTRDPGFNFNDGGQFRLSVGHDVGRGTIDVDLKHIDDHVGFYLGQPYRVSGSDVKGVPGLDATTGILSGPETQLLRLRTNNGQINYDLTSGTSVKLDQATLHLVQDLGDGWHMDDRFRYRTTDQVRIGLFPASVQTGALRLTQLLPTVKGLFPTATSLAYRYVDSPGTLYAAPQNASGLEVDDSARDIAVSEHEMMNDLRFSRKFSFGGQTHDVTLGAYYMTAHETFTRYAAVLVLDGSNHARPMDVVALDSTGAVVGSATENGVIRYGSEFANGMGDQRTMALYAADEWQVNDKLRIDFGARQESMKTNGAAEGSKTVNLGQTTTLADRNYLTGSGVFAPYSRTFSTLTWTAGANYQLDKSQGVFVRYTSAARLPSISDFITNAGATPVINHTDMFEAGYKLSRPWLDAYVTLFDTEYHNYGVSQNVYSNVTNGYVSQNYFADTRDYGLEIDGDLRPNSWFDIGFAATIQQPEFTSLKYTVLSGGVLTTLDFNGKQLLRVPKTSFSVSPAVNLFHDRLRAEVSAEYYSDRYADAANTQKLPAYTVINANLRYQFTPDLTFYLNGYNLTNQIGLTEGNPRSGELLSAQAGAPVFIARSIVGRTIKASVLYKF